MEKPANAVIVPAGFYGPGSAVAQHQKAGAWWGPLCGCRRFWWFHVNCNSHRLGVPLHDITRIDDETANTSVFFENGHPMAGQDRYRWYFLRRETEDSPWTLGERADGPFERPELPRAGFRREDAPEYRDPQIIRSASDDRAKRLERQIVTVKAILADETWYRQFRDRIGATDAEMEALFAHYERTVF